MGALEYKNKLENIANISKNSSGKSGADLEQAALVRLGETSVGEGKDGPRLEQLAGEGNIND